MPGKPMEGFQRKYLRGLAHDLQPVCQVGQAGVTTDLIAAVEAALRDHELIKVRMRAPKDKKAMAAAIAKGARAELCGLIGHTLILYRAFEKDPVIKLPSRS